MLTKHKNKTISETEIIIILQQKSSRKVPQKAKQSRDKNSLELIK